MPVLQPGVRRLACAVAAALATGGVAAAALPDPPEGDGRRPRVALVLSGGGGRGAAHIGVLRALEAMRVPVDLVVGTSIGAVVGGLYAAGFSPDAIENELAQLDWNELFTDRLARTERSYRRKQDDAELLIQGKLRFRGWKPYVPAGILGGQRLGVLLRNLELASRAGRDFDQFPIRFRAIATDLLTGRPVVLDRGSLAQAMRASMSIPGAFPPTEIDGRQLVDGGLSDNLPVAVALDLGARRIIAVDLTSPLSDERELGSFLTVFSQQNNFLTAGNTEASRRRLRSGDVLIRPDLRDITFVDFERSREAVALGEQAARASEAALAPLARAGGDEPPRTGGPVVPLVPGPIVDGWRLENTSWVSDRVVRAGVAIPVGVPLEAHALERSIMRLYGLEWFGFIDHDLERAGGRSTLVLRTPAKPHGRNGLRFGVSFSDDFDGNGAYALAVRHQRLAVNRRGGEWQSVAQLGRRSLLASELYQPLDPALRWFVAPRVAWSRETRTLYDAGAAVRDVSIHERELGLDVGRVLGRWGELRLGVFERRERVETRVGAPEPATTVDDRGLAAALRVDTLDAPAFPRRGLALEAQLRRTEPRAWRSLAAGGAASSGRNTVFAGVEAADTSRGASTLGTELPLGGLFRLSGLARDELVGPTTLLARIIYYRELASVRLGALSSRIHAGAALEAGNVFERGESIGLDALLGSGAVFVGAESPVGPVYLGHGWSEGGRRSWHVVVGQRF